MGFNLSPKPHPPAPLSHTGNKNIQKGPQDLNFDARRNSNKEKTTKRRKFRAKGELKLEEKGKNYLTTFGN